jgi:hypothetical protein
MQRSGRVVALSVVVVSSIVVWTSLRSGPRSVDSTSDSTVSLRASDASEVRQRLDGSLPSVTLRQEIDSAFDERPADDIVARDVPLVDVEVNVLEDRHPRVGTLVRCFGDEPEGSGFLVGDPSSRVIAEARANGAGMALFRELPAGRYGIEIEVDGEQACRYSATFAHEPPRTRVVIPLGTAGLEGRVFDHDGRDAQNVRVLARQRAADGEAALWFVTRTDSNGRYRLRGFAGGESHELTAAVFDPELGLTRPLQLAAGEVRSLDFGTALGRVNWSGTVVLSSGLPLAGPGRLCFVSRDSAGVEQRMFGADGRFDLSLPGGSYEARLTSPDGLVLGTVDAFRDLATDLVVPGVVVHGRIAYVGTKHRFARGPVREVAISIEPRDGHAVSTSLIRREDTYSVCGLPAGSYVVTTRPWILDGVPDGRLTLEIGTASSELVLDLSITDP